MSTPALDIAEYLEDEGLGVFGGDSQWSLHVAREPIAPDDVVTIYNTGGAGPIVVDEAEIRNPSVQVRVRGQDYEAVHARQNAIADALIRPLERNIGDHRYIAINMTGDIIDVGADENDRYLTTANYDIIRQPAGEST